MEIEVPRVEESTLDESVLDTFVVITPSSLYVDERYSNYCCKTENRFLLQHSQS